LTSDVVLFFSVWTRPTTHAQNKSGRVHSVLMARSRNYKASCSSGACTLNAGGSNIVPYSSSSESAAHAYPSMRDIGKWSRSDGGSLRQLVRAPPMSTSPLHRQSSVRRSGGDQSHVYPSFINSKGRSLVDPSTSWGDTSIMPVIGAALASRRRRSGMRRRRSSGRRGGSKSGSMLRRRKRTRSRSRSRSRKRSRTRTKIKSPIMKRRKRRRRSK